MRSPTAGKGLPEPPGATAPNTGLPGARPQAERVRCRFVSVRHLHILCTEQDTLAYYDANALRSEPRMSALDDRRQLVHELFLALKRGYDLGGCGSCETFYLMAKLCLEEGGAGLTPEERSDVTSWVEAGSILDLDFGCEDACAVIPLYARLSR